MNNTIHEPECVGDAKNALGYFLIASFVTCGAAFILGGMLAPVFWPWLRRRTAVLAREDVAKGLGVYEDLLKDYRRKSAILFTIWFIISWAFFALANHMSG